MRMGSDWRAKSMGMAACVLVTSCALGQERNGAEGSGFAQFDGIKVHYETRGDGETRIVLVPGWACTTEVWEGQLEGLSTDATVVAIDLPGHGQSDLPGSKITMDYFADSIAAVMDEVGFDDAVLVGHSNGVPVIRQFYRRHPERTAGLVAADGALMPMFSVEQGERFLDQLAGPNYVILIRSIFSGFLPQGYPVERKERILNMITSTPKQVALDSFEAVIDPAIWEPDPIEVPLLVINTEGGGWTEEYQADVFDLQPEAEYRVMSGVTHMLQMDEPQQFNALIVEFLRDKGL